MKPQTKFIYYFLKSNRTFGIAILVSLTPPIVSKCVEL